MGYFSNGSEGMDYEQRYCLKCQHYGPEDGPGCAVWAVHLIHNYGQNESKDVASILGILIPLSHSGENKECAMFLPGEGATDA